MSPVMSCTWCIDHRARRSASSFLLSARKRDAPTHWGSPGQSSALLANAAAMSESPDEPLLLPCRWLGCAASEAACRLALLPICLTGRSCLSAIRGEASSEPAVRATPAARMASICQFGMPAACNASCFNASRLRLTTPWRIRSGAGSSRQCTP